jgi:hypothetical protein
LTYLLLALGFLALVKGASLLVLGVTATVRPLPFHAENTVELIAMLGANLLLFAIRTR